MQAWDRGNVGMRSKSAAEHREQIKSMLSSLEVTPPNIDGWDYEEVTQALIPIST